MTDTPDCQEVTLIITTALASSIISALPKPWQAVAGLSIKAHIMEIDERAKAAGSDSATHSEAKAVLQTFFEKLVANQAA